MTIYEHLRAKQDVLIALPEGNARQNRRTQRAMLQIECVFALLVHAWLDLADQRAGLPACDESPFTATQALAAAQRLAHEEREREREVVH